MINNPVGDFIFLRKSDKIPADIIIISSSEPDSLCYVETKNLDGETNLKIKKGIPEFSHIKSPADCFSIFGHIDSEPPSTNLYAYNATVHMMPTADCDSKERKHLPIGATGLLLRGCVLRNTRWVIGLVVFTGADTKIMLNSGDTPSKRSNVDKQINPHVLLNFSILSALCLICAVAGALYNGSFRFQLSPDYGITHEHYYSDIVAGIITFFNCLIIFQNLIPIALYISLEVTKSAQSFFIHIDSEMCDTENGNNAEPRSWNLCDDLGQIEYIFSDKTGTLTSNTMEFRKASINGHIYGNMYQHSGEEESKQAIAKMSETFKEMFDTRYISKAPTFVDTNLAHHLKFGEEQSQKIREFFTLLSVCHTVLVENTDALSYNAQSPDEAALVSTARDVGFAFVGRDNNDCIVNVMGEIRKYTILHMMEFNSDRKRMSVIIRRPEGQYILLCKGADSVIYDRLSVEANDPQFTAKTLNHLSQFANDGKMNKNIPNEIGLRTLCLAYRIIPDDEYHQWALLYQTAQSEIFDREKKCDELAELIEKDLNLMGATAIEDKLQVGVPDSIATLYKAGIKIWVLTGDKMETAINIGFSCELLKKNMILIVIKSESKEDTLVQLKEALSRFWDSKGSPIDGKIHALIIDGESLRFGLDIYCKSYLLELGCRCRAVICCRVSPLQKAMVVKLIREGLGAICLAIGDGANDVSMIQEADIGIGISGKEGLQAVMASDYAIGQFRFLTRLLLVHGKWAYIRSSAMVLNYFYKNVVWLLILFWHQFFSGFDAGLAMDFTYSMFFNTVFTFLPTIFIGIFDQDINDRISVLVPQIYKKGIHQELYSTAKFWEILACALYHSVICYGVGFWVVNDNILGRSGFDCDSISFGTIISFSAIIIVNIFSISNWNSWTWITHLSLWISLGVWLIYVVSYSSSVQSPSVGLVNVVLTSPTFYFSVLISVIVALGPIFILKYCQQYFYPNDTDIIKEILSMNKDYDWEKGLLGKNDSVKMKTESQSISVIDSANAIRKTQHLGEIPYFIRKSAEHLMKIRKTFSSEELNKQPRHPLGVRNNKKELPMHSTISSDGFGFCPCVKEKQKTNNQFEHANYHKTSANEMRQNSLGNVMKKAGGYFAKKLKPSSGAFTKLAFKGPSLTYMGNNGGQVINTGFAFSQDTGMTDLIAPKTLPTIIEEAQNEEFKSVHVRNRKCMCL